MGKFSKARLRSSQHSRSSPVQNSGDGVSRKGLACKQQAALCTLLYTLFCTPHTLYILYLFIQPILDTLCTLYTLYTLPCTHYPVHTTLYTLPCTPYAQTVLQMLDIIYHLYHLCYTQSVTFIPPIQPTPYTVCDIIYHPVSYTHLTLPTKLSV